METLKTGRANLEYMRSKIRERNPIKMMEQRTILRYSISSTNLSFCQSMSQSWKIGRQTNLISSLRLQRMRMVRMRVLLNRRLA